MITQKDLQAAIAECNGQRNPNASTCLKLAAYYIINDKLFGEQEEAKNGYSFASHENQIGEVTYSSNTEFSDAIAGMDMNELIAIIDELMSVLQLINPRLYNGVMRKIMS